MTQHNIYLNEQERDKIKQVMIMYQIKSVNEAIKFLISEYRIRIEDKGYNDPQAPKPE